MSLFSKIRLRNGLFELSLIFIGITLALAFENLNSDRARRGQEKELLAELVQDLEETQQDLARDIQSAENKLGRNEALLRWFNGDPEAWDNHRTEFESINTICNLPGLFPKTSAYESIKSAGLDLVRNSSIRGSISTLFELSLERVRMRETDFRDDASELCTPFLISNFAIVGESQILEIQGQSIVPGLTFPRRVVRAETMEPLNSEVLKQDTKSRFIAVIMHQETSNLLRTYRELDQEIDFLKTLIVEELEQ